MVFLEAAAAGALLYKHHLSKERHKQYQQEAEEDLRRRGWDGGAKMGSDDMVKRTNSGLMPPGQGQPLRPLSAPPVSNPISGSMGTRDVKDDGLAYGKWYPSGYDGHTGSSQQENPLAYGKFVPEQRPPPYPLALGHEQPYQPPPSAPPPGQYQYAPHQYPSQGEWQGSPPPLQPYQSFEPPSGQLSGQAIYPLQQGYQPQQGYPLPQHYPPQQGRPSYQRPPGGQSGWYGSGPY